jgi:hypothetical protein
MMTRSVVIADLLRRAGQALDRAIRAEDAGDDDLADREFATTRALQAEAARYEAYLRRG